jgi:SAM-dependent methyltransferase
VDRSGGADPPCLGAQQMSPERHAVESKAVTREIRAGRTVFRSLANATLAAMDAPIHGTVLDLAAGDGSGAVRRLFPDATWVGLDLVHRPNVRADADAPLPFRDSCVDAAVCMWYLYMSANPVAVLREIRRVLKPGGSVLLGTPLVFPLNPEPRDLWRFTDEGLHQIFSRAGFDRVDVVSFGGRWTSAAYLVEPFLRPRRLLLPGAVRACLALDRWAARGPGSGLAPHPVGYVSRAEA